MTRRRLHPRKDRFVVAVQMRLDTDGLAYRKWGNEQSAKPIDWMLDNDGDVYAVDAATFARTYAEVLRGHCIETALVWSGQAAGSGRMATLEGHTEYSKGDWLVSSRADGSDACAVSVGKFAELYEPDD